MSHENYKFGKVVIGIKNKDTYEAIDLRSQINMLLCQKKGKELKTFSITRKVTRGRCNKHVNDIFVFILFLSLILLK